MLGDDFFDRIAREFFSENSDLARERYNNNSVSRDQNSYVSNMNADYDFVEVGNNFFVIVNFPDTIKKSDIIVEVDEGFDNEHDEDNGWFSGEKVLSIRNRGQKNSFLKLKIPKKIAKRKFKHVFNNGIMEVLFEK